MPADECWPGGLLVVAGGCLSALSVTSRSARAIRFYRTVDRKLRALEVGRDRLAEKIKAELEAAAFGGRPVPRAVAQTAACEAIIARAEAMVGVS